MLKKGEMGVHLGEGEERGKGVERGGDGKRGKGVHCVGLSKRPLEPICYL